MRSTQHQYPITVEMATPKPLYTSSTILLLALLSLSTHMGFSAEEPKKAQTEIMGPTVLAQEAILLAIEEAHYTITLIRRFLMLKSIHAIESQQPKVRKCIEKLKEKAKAVQHSLHHLWLLRSAKLEDDVKNLKGLDSAMNKQYERCRCVIEGVDGEFDLLIKGQLSDLALAIGHALSRVEEWMALGGGGP